MREVKFYCDICGKEIDSYDRTSSNYIPVVKKVGKHGMKKVTLKVMDNRGNILDFCDDCRVPIAILFGGKECEDEEGKCQ